MANILLGLNHFKRARCKPVVEQLAAVQKEHLNQRLELLAQLPGYNEHMVLPGSNDATSDAATPDASLAQKICTKFVALPAGAGQWLYNHTANG